MCPWNTGQTHSKQARLAARHRAAESAAPSCPRKEQKGASPLRRAGQALSFFTYVGETTLEVTPSLAHWARTGKGVSASGEGSVLTPERPGAICEQRLLVVCSMGSAYQRSRRGPWFEQGHGLGRSPLCHDYSQSHRAGPSRTSSDWPHLSRQESPEPSPQPA